MTDTTEPKTQDHAPEPDPETPQASQAPDAEADAAPDEEAEAAAEPEAPADDPTDEVAALREEAARFKDQALRALAEAENTRRRFEREKQDAQRYGIAGFARDILDVADNLARALAAAPADQLADHALAEQLSVGVSMTEKMLADAFAKHGITRIDPAGEKFDPNFHQAMFEVPDPNSPPGTVVQVIQVGYALNGRLLRPAMVGIAKGGEPPQSVDTEA